MKHAGHIFVFRLPVPGNPAQFVRLSLSKFICMRYLRSLLFTFSTLLCFFYFAGAQDTTQHIVGGRTNSPEQQKKPYLIMISVDGLRYDLVDKYDAKFLKKKRSEGVAATSMQPAFPSMTFPNHYTLATGLYPSHHGIVANNFYAGKDAQYYYAMNIAAAVQNPGFYGGIPIWVLAEKQKMVSANFFWVGSEAPIDSTFSTYYFNYNEAIPIDRRIEIVKQWLELPEERRPHLIMFYLPEVDHQLHRYGVTSDKVRDAVRFVDEAIRKMNEMTDQLGLPVNYVLVSDHGMMDIDKDNPILQPAALDTSLFKVAFSATIVHLYAKNKRDIKPSYKALKKEANDYSVFLKKNTLKRWHYGTKDDYYNRLGDIILVAGPGKAFSFSGREPLPGNHGFDNEIPEMQATFYAWGPGFKTRYKIPSFENIHVYPLVADLLGLKILCNIDGDPSVLKGVLK